jgi:DNA-binding transcriptional MerR regulator
MSAKSHLSIGDVLTLLRQEFPDVSISKIRFLETQGLVTPQRTASGLRKFTKPDVDRLQWILQQQRDHFFPLKVIKEKIDDVFPPQPQSNGAKTPPTDAQRAAALERVSHVVAALQEGPREAAQAAALHLINHWHLLRSLVSEERDHISVLELGLSRTFDYANLCSYSITGIQ